MGVTYKLKQEVIDLIVQKKKADPSLSCRRLVTILREIFRIDVSKSSINDVIKEFRLSNPVGRRSAKAPKNFNIPQERKQELLAQVIPFLPPEKIAEQPVSMSEEQTPVQIPVEPLVQISDNPSDTPSEEPSVEEAVHLSPDLLTPIAVEVKASKPWQIDWSDEGGLLYENMGFYLVRAFMQDLLRKPIVGEICSRMAGMDGVDPRLLEAGVFMKPMGILTMADIESPAYRAMGMIFEEDPRVAEQVLGKFLGRNIALTAWTVALETELSMALARGYFFKCEADSGRKFYLSADLCELCASSDQGRSYPVFRAIERAIDSLVTMKKPLVVDVSEGLGPALQDFLMLLDGHLADKLDKIELWSDNAEIIWNYTIKGRISHDFIVKLGFEVGYDGVFEWHDNASAYEHRGIDQKYAIKEGFYTINKEKELKLRALCVEKEGFDAKSLLLTNIPESEFTSSQVLEIYFENHSFMVKTEPGNTKKPVQKIDLMAKVLKNMTQDIVLSCVFESFEQHTANSLGLDIEALRGLYPVAGRVRYQKNSAYIHFELEPESPHAAELQTAVDHANCCCIKDYLGRRVHFSLQISSIK